MHSTKPSQRPSLPANAFGRIRLASSLKLNKWLWQCKLGMTNCSCVWVFIVAEKKLLIKLKTHLNMHTHASMSFYCKLGVKLHTNVSLWTNVFFLTSGTSETRVIVSINILKCQGRVRKHFRKKRYHQLLDLNYKQKNLKQLKKSQVLNYHQTKKK